MNVDVILVGQGLAGSILAWQLIQRRFNVVVIDENHRGSASMVAAGLINPITGMRLVKSWNVDSCLPVALDFFRSLETILQLPLYHEKTILRLFSGVQEQKAYAKRHLQADYQDYLGSSHEPDGIQPDSSPLGGFNIHKSGYLDTKALLIALKNYLRQRQQLIETPLSYADINIVKSKVSWKNITSDHLVFCEGHRISGNPWFSWLPLQPAQGEILTLKTRKPLPDKIINCGKWLLPIEPDKIKVGATFQWQPIDGVPTAAGKHQLLEACRHMGWESNNGDVVEHLCGVRPGTRDKRPFLGLHPQYPQLSVFNGFGAKGSLWIPYYAQLFAEHLRGSAKLPDEVDIKRFSRQL